MFNLNIDQYNKNELLELLSINKDSLYDIIEINSKYEMLVNKIQNSNKTSTEKKEICNFLEQVKNNIIINLSEESNKGKINTLTTAINNSTLQVNPLHMSSSSKSKNVFVEKILTIDTRFRPNYSTDNGTNFIYTMSQPVTNVTKMNLISVEIPQVYCIMSDKYQNSSFMLIIDDNEFMINLPDIYLLDHGSKDYNNYSKLINLCNNYFKKHSNELVNRCLFYLPELDDDVTIIKNLFFMFDNEGLDETNIPKNIELHFEKTPESSTAVRDLRSKLGWMLGFRSPIVKLKSTNELDNIFKTDSALDETYFKDKLSVRADVPMQLTSAKYLYLIIDDFNSNKLENFVVDDITLKGCDVNVSLGGNILAKILFDSGSEFYTVDRLITVERQYTGPVDIQKIKISLIDEFGRILDLNNIDWSFSIKLSSG
jgi:hypothetical protein|tara:strand:- start:25 stop:1305 length:1281 start_codon:yes stop_codon:yes gene_type:complete